LGPQRGDREEGTIRLRCKAVNSETKRTGEAIFWGHPLLGEGSEPCNEGLGTIDGRRESSHGTPLGV